MTSVLSTEALNNVRRVAYVTLGIGVVSIATAAFHVYAVQSQVADLRVQLDDRAKRLRDDRRVIGDAPKETQLAALDRSRAVSCLRSRLSDLANRQNVSVQEFQAATDELPYLTTYAADSKDPGWMQVPVRLTLAGPSTALSTVLASLRDLEVPFEVDNVELTRRSTDNSGMATVSEQIQMRVLFYQGGV